MGSIKKNFIYNSIYQILAILTPLITSPYISRVLGSNGIGVYSYNYTIANYFLLFAMLGVGNYGNRSIARIRDDREQRSKVFWSIYIFQLLFAVVILGLYLVYLLFICKENLFIAGIELLVVLSAVFDVTWLFFGLELFKVTTIRSILVKISTVAGILLFVKDENDIWIYCLIMSLSILMNQVLLWPFLRRYVVWRKPTIREVLSNLKPNIILFIPVIAISLYSYMDKLMLGTFSTYSELGYYENAEKITNIPMSLITALGTVMLPRMSYITKNNDLKMERQLNEYSMMFTTFVSVAFAFGIMGVAEPFVPFFFGEKFFPVIVLLLILAPKMILVSWCNIIRNQYLLPHAKDVSYTISVFIGAVINLVVNFLLISKYGAVGVAIGTICAEAAITIVQTVMVWGKMEIPKYIVNSIPFLSFGILMFLVIYQLNVCNYVVTVVIRILIGGSLYLLLSLGYMFIFKREIIDKLLKKK